MPKKAFLPSFTLQIVRLFKKIPITFSVIGLNHFWQETNPGLSGKILQNLETFLTRTLKYNWVITDDYDFYKNYKKKNISFIPNGAEIKSLPKIKKWPDFTFLFVGRLDKRKGVNYLLQAFKIAKEKHPRIKLRIIGSGPEEKNYKQLSQELNLKDVKFVGRVSDEQLKKEYAKAHCFVLPSLWEGHPLVLFEAFSYKLPVISTNVGSLNLFINSKNGYLVPPKNKKKLTQVMIKAIENRNLAKMGENGCQMVKKDYSWKKTVNNYFDVFKQFLR